MHIDANLLGNEAQFLLDQAMKLPVVERAKLADKLSSTVDPMANQEWQAAWSPEIARRIADVENEVAKLSSWEDARRRLWEGFDARSTHASAAAEIIEAARLAGRSRSKGRPGEPPHDTLSFI